MTWDSPHCHFALSPEEIEEMKVTVELLQRLEEAPEIFLYLFQPKFAHLPFWRDRLFEKICKLVKKEATKEIVQLETQLKHDAEQKAGEP